METKTMEKAADGALQFAHLTHEVSKARTLVSDIIEDGKRKAQRTVKHAFVAAEDCVEDTTHYIKRHPWQSMGVAVGLGVGTGILATWLFERGVRIFTRNGNSEFRAAER
jgi:ElaB/YqjD/DUF883 family membrane-anchored ribosome-binding protein